MSIRKYREVLTRICNASKSDIKSAVEVSEMLEEATANDEVLVKRLGPPLMDSDPNNPMIFLSDEVKETIAELIEDVEIKICEMMSKSSTECVCGWIITQETRPSEKRALLFMALSEVLAIKAEQGDDMSLRFLGAAAIASRMRLDDDDFCKFLSENVLHKKIEEIVPVKVDKRAKNKKAK